MTEQEYEALRESRMAGSVFENPIRRHEPDGIGMGPISPNLGTHATDLKDEVFQVLTEFALSCCDPEGLGHIAAPEIIVRAAMCKKLVESLRPQCRPSGVGYQEPPPARCQHCDES